MKKASSETQYFLSWLLLVHSVAYIMFWLTNPQFFASVNLFLQKAVNLKWDFVTGTMILFGILGLWALVRIIGHLLQINQLLFWNRIFFIFSLIFLFLFYGIFITMFIKEPIQAIRLEQWTQYFLPFLVAAGLIILIGITLPFVRTALRNRKENPPYAAILIPIWIFVWSFPIWNLPDMVYRGELPTKPGFMAHRGASTLAPENTLASMRVVQNLAAQSAVILHTSEDRAIIYSPIIGMESDVRIALDGIPILMHDATLLRTTDVSHVFPERQEEVVETFTYQELQALDAGSWFLQQYEFADLAPGYISNSDYLAYANEKIPTLAEWLQLTRGSSLSILFDIYLPKLDQAVRFELIDQVFQLVKAQGINEQIWMLADEDVLRELRPQAPDMQWVAGVDYKQPVSSAQLIVKGYDIVNSQYGLSKQLIKDYQAKGLRVNLWTVDETWQYSRLWIAGVDSVTTNNLQGFLNLEKPFLSVSYKSFILIWCGFGMLLAAFTAWRTLRNKKVDQP